MRAPEEPLPEGLIADLLTPEGHPHDPDAKRGIEHVQTHLSHVLLLERRVYKLHKAADLGFVCFASRAERNADCESEVRLNRRLAPSVYLGVAPILPADGPLPHRVGALVEEPGILDGALEHCVVMQRLEAGRDALSLLDRGALEPAHLDRVAVKIARFHEALTPIEEAGAGDITDPARANMAAIQAASEDIVRARDAAALESATRQAIARCRPTFERRRAAGRVVEGHGDLHLQHVWFPSDPAAVADPPIIDCLAFSAALRVIDVAAEVAFLVMDLAYRGAGVLGERFLARYALETDDTDLYSIVDVCVSHRAAVRAKVAALAAADPGIAAGQRRAAAESAQRHVELARSALEPREPGVVILVGGAIGTGKSTVARALAARSGAVVIASDRVRKARLGLDPTERLDAGVDAGAYAPEARAAVYEAMLERAGAAVDSGRGVVLDATFSERAMRDHARAWAERRGARCVFVHTRCDPEIVRTRLAARQARGDDASDAGPELLDESLRRWEALEAGDPWPDADRATLDTGEPGLDAQVEAVAGTLGLPGRSVWDRPRAS